MTDNLIAVCGVGILLWSQAAFSIPNSQLALDIAAESTAKVVLYYMGKPVVSDQIDFPLPVNGNSQKFEQTSTFSIWLAMYRSLILFLQILSLSYHR